jgi:RND family efflux transporter MFP subunit
LATHLHTGPEFETTDERRPVKKKSHLGFFVLVLLVALGLGAGIFYELKERKGLQQALTAAATTETTDAATPSVTVSRLRVAPSDATVDIPGQTAALQETPMYTRTDGYIRQRNVEIGQKVKKGDLLVEIDTPDLDQQIAQARATLAQSKAALAQFQANAQALDSTWKLAQLTAGRTKSLFEQGVLARQDTDNATAASDTAGANFRAAQENVKAQDSVIEANDANIRRLVEQKKYARLEAPFDGVVTYRDPRASDVGTLVTSGSGTNVHELIRVSQISKLLVYVSVPQNYAPMIHPGQVGNLQLQEFPGRVFPARVQNTGSSLDPATRTMQTLLEVDNPQGTLLPGMYVAVRFVLPHRVDVLRLSSEALIVRSDGPTTAVVGDDNKVHIRHITLGRDYGNEVEVTSGLEPSDRVVLNPGDNIREGVTVEPKLRAAK